MFEAVWGALYKDLGCNFDATYKVYCKLLPLTGSAARGAMRRQPG